MSEATKELDALVHHCDVTISALNDLQAEVLAYIQRRRVEVKEIRRETIEKLEAITAAKAIEARRR